MRRLDELLAELDSRALVVAALSARDPAMAPFAGGSRLGKSLLIAPRGRPPRLAYLSSIDRQEAALSGLELLTPEALDVVRWARDGAPPEAFWANVMARAFQLSELGPGTLALAGLAPSGRMVAVCERLRGDGWSFVPGEPLVERLRKRKSAAELAEIRRVAEANAAVFRRVAELLAAAVVRDGELWLEGERLRVERLRREISRQLAEHQLEQPEGNIVAPAEEGAVPHTGGTDERVLRAGESLVVDLFPRGRMWADGARTFCVGEPPAALAAAHARVCEALELARGRVRPGESFWDVHLAVCEHFEAAGFPTFASDPLSPRGYVHPLGHGVGYEVHELPTCRESLASGGELEVGDVFTLEPGLYDPEAGWGVRLEDLCHLGEDGVEVLAPLPLALDPREWR